MTMRGKGRSVAMLATGVMVASILSAPVAVARPTCQDGGSTKRCETRGSTSIKAVPQTSAGSLNAGPPGRRRSRS